MRKLLLDTGAGLLFFLVLLATGDIYLATWVGIGLGVAIVVWGWTRQGRFDPMQGLGLGLVVVMGGATILTRDPRFVMFKPSLLQICLGCAMLRPGWMLRYISPANAARTPRFAVVAVGYVYAATMFAMALVNGLIATFASQETWALYAAIGPIAVFSLLGGGAYLVLRRLAIRAGRLTAQGAA
jgi:intracellular septation protein